MKIQELKLKNFRCFNELNIKFSDDYTIFIGNNGVGKSSILDALQILLQTFTLNAQHDLTTSRFDYFANGAIQVSDARLISMEIGSIIDQQPQFPVVIKVIADIGNNIQTSWSYELKNSLSRNSHGTSDVLNYVQDLQKKLSAENKITCPVIAYYGTQRQWIKTLPESSGQSPFIPQMSGYINSLNSQAFNINTMHHWFSRMLLISRKKNVPEFEAVRTAIANCYKAINNPSSLCNVIIDYDAEREDIEIRNYFNDNRLEVLPLSYLSEGNKSILAMVADIAYRMAVLNPHLLDKVIEETDGVVLIDEIDMHLHPAWQRKIISALHQTFPKVQFICTTHSPIVLTNVPQEKIQILDNGKIYTPDVKTYGRDVNSILREVMQTEIRPSETSSKLSSFADAISNKNFDLAEKILNELREQLGENDAEVVSAQVALDLEKF
ncbi:MAG: AAA family ATPase [Selenomonadaceae bacterium]|nr:AAA family ATPase [Selenomonadaceae bacterium]